MSRVTTAYLLLASPTALQSRFYKPFFWAARIGIPGGQELTKFPASQRLFCLLMESRSLRPTKTTVQKHSFGANPESIPLEQCALHSMV